MTRTECRYPTAHAQSEDEEGDEARVGVLLKDGVIELMRPVTLIRRSAAKATHDAGLLSRYSIFSFDLAI